MRYRNRLDDLKNKIKQRESEAKKYNQFDFGYQSRIMDAKVHKPLVGGGKKE